MNRRSLLKQGLLSGAALIGTAHLARAADICRTQSTPPQTEGPFYPVIDQLDKDSDLVNVQGASQAATGKVIIIEGRVQDQHCRAVAGALVEIWQACASGRYNHHGDSNPAPLDPNFQYWGKALTNAEGFYRFRTIVPGAYPADTNWMRPPHIHFKVARKAYMELTTQMYFANEKFNDEDLILQRLSQAEQEDVIVALKQESAATPPTGTFNITIEKL